MNKDIDTLVRIEDFFNKHTEFTLKTFPKSTPQSSINKLREETDELEHEIVVNRKDLILEEVVDCVMCLFDISARCGFNGNDFKEAFEKKYQKNINRKWKVNPDGSYSHVKQLPEPTDNN